jgi:nucleotide-binding universal stress UspA family protein
MRSYRRILGLIDLSAHGETVARRALQMARVCNATLGLAVIVDYTPGCECDHAPPQRMRDDIVNDGRAKLDAIIADIGAGGAEAIVVAASTRAAIEEIAESWQPDLILVGSHSPYGLQDPSRVEPGSSAELPADMLVVQAGRPSLAGRLLHALSEAF